ncbi:MAG: GPW/gp25 family protein [Pseudomonadales bacterium]|nr:GPW/gp25 family protein [Pseudomonadales bacterium]
MARLLTPTGELASLGHPDYGSRLHEVVGRVNTETTRNLIRLYILESLKKEPRVEKIELITVSLVHRQPSMVSVELEVKPIDSTEVVTIGPFTISL